VAERILVIGSNSFSGSHFVKWVLGEGAEVIGVSRSPEPHEVFLPYKLSAQADFRFVQFDLNHHLRDILRLADDFQPEYVVNFAAQSMVAQSWQFPEHWFETNTVAAVKLHDGLRKCSYLKKYVHVSTPEVYGHCEGLVKENVFYSPSTPYAVSRAAADLSLMSFFRNYAFPVVFTRAANVYGPGQQLYRIVPRAILYFLTDRVLELHGGGHSIRSFIHIRDVVSGMAKIMRQGTPPDIFHLSTRENLSIRSLVERIASRLGKVFNDCVRIVDERPGKDAAYLLDSSNAFEKFSWEPAISLDAGIDEVIVWVKENLNVLEVLPQDYIHKP
jgi:dTDP-glucose 4,6-dehydratase